MKVLQKELLCLSRSRPATALYVWLLRPKDQVLSTYFAAINICHSFFVVIWNILRLSSYFVLAFPNIILIRSRFSSRHHRQSIPVKIFDSEVLICDVELRMCFVLLE